MYRSSINRIGGSGGGGSGGSGGGSAVQTALATPALEETHQRAAPTVLNPGYVATLGGPSSHIAIQPTQSAAKMSDTKGAKKGKKGKKGKNPEKRKPQRIRRGSAAALMLDGTTNSTFEI